MSLHCSPPPIDPALNIIKDLLEQDDTLQDRTVLSVQNIIELSGFCLHNTDFSFQNKFYEQVEGAAMGSPISSIVVNLYMKYFNREALCCASIPLGVGTGLWMTLLLSNNSPINNYFWTILIISAKYSVIGTLTHRAKIVCTRTELFSGELQHLREALVNCKYPRWVIQKVPHKYINSN